MIPNTQIVSSSPLVVLVLYPEAISSSQSPRQDGVTPNFRSQASASKVPSVSQLQDGDHILPGPRRLSLAPGLGAGVQKMASTALQGSSPLAHTPAAPPPASPTSASRASAIHQSSARRDQGEFRWSSAAHKLPRASVAVPSSSKPASNTATRGRGGNESDELVDVLRQSGFEVTAIRNISHLPGAASRHPPTPGSRASDSDTSLLSTARRVALVPLGDAPALPSLSLLLESGTTPTAVCFQQDILDRARRAEDEWLATAVGRIQQVREQVEQPEGESNESKTIILAYSANGTPSQSAVTACVNAGASGVLSPPYDSHTARVLSQLVTAAGEGDPSSAFELLSSSPVQSTQSLHNLPGQEDDTRVVLPPTALAMGAEHQSEHILSETLATQRRKSSQLSQTSATSNDLHHNTSLSGHPRTSSSSVATASLSTPSTSAVDTGSSPTHLAHSLLSGQMGGGIEASRRRSVDTGGLALAFDRMSKRMVPVDQHGGISPSSAQSSINVVAGDREQETADGLNTTEFAELLGEMYQQTMSSIDIQMGDYEALAPPLSGEDRARLVGLLSSWDFRPHMLSQSDLYHIACLVFEATLHIEGVVELGIDYDQIKQWLFAVRAIYHAPNPYHNYVHAIDVLQATYQFLIAIGVAPPFSFFLELEPGKSVWCRPTEEEQPAKGNGTAWARRILRPQDVLTIMMAAIGHDVGHPGLSNAFMKNAKVPLSVVYDDKSVLENMHCMLIVQLLRKHGFGYLLGSASAADLQTVPSRSAFDSRGFRRVLYSAILATDMSLHFAWIQRLKDLGVAMQGEPTDRSSQCEEDRVMISQALIKCADISNPSRPIDVSEHWSTVLLDEWTKQASLEEELSLPVSVAAGVDARLQFKGQVGFIDLFTEPLFRATASVLPEMEVYAQACSDNRAIWQSRLEQLEADEEQNEALSENLRSTVGAPLPSAEDDRYRTLFPLILPPELITPMSQKTTLLTPTLPNHSSPAAKAVHMVYTDEVHEKAPARHVLALTGFDNSRRMSTPEALLARR